MELNPEQAPTSNPYFEIKELQRLVSLEGKQLTKAIYHNWVNLAAFPQTSQWLMWLELRFEDGDIIFLTAGDTSDGMSLATPDIEAERKRLKEQFQGKISLVTTDMTTEEHWAPALDMPLNSVELEKVDENSYYNDAMLFIWGAREHMLEIRAHHEDGILVDWFEDDPGPITDAKILSEE